MSCPQPTSHCDDCLMAKNRSKSGVSYVYHKIGFLKDGRIKVRCYNCYEAKQKFGGVTSMNIIESNKFVHDPDVKHHICVASKKSSELGAQHPPTSEAPVELDYAAIASLFQIVRNMTEKPSLLLYNLRQVVQVVDDDTPFLSGADFGLGKLKILESESSDLAVFVVDGKVKEVAKFEHLQTSAAVDNFEKLDCNGGCLIPGLIDGHSHPVFAGDRVHEFAMKLAGATYMDVQAAGGGIHFTTTKTREASKEELLTDFKKIADEMLRSGTTTLEAKSGYGLDYETELKMLQVIDDLARDHPLEVSATFCGAHAIPRGSTEDSHKNLIVNQMIPALKGLKTEGKLPTLENIDVFCEKGVFELDSSKEILETGKEAGFAINFHADELHPLGGAEMGARLGARAMSHLEEISPDGISAMKEAGTVATLLPSTAYMLRLKPPPVRQMIEAGVIVALGSDFNPNAYCLSMPTIMHLACVLFHMSMNEVLIAATLNAAHSIGRGTTHGAIAVGRVADFVVLDAPKWEHLVYRFAAHHTVIAAVVKGGQIVYSKDR